MEESHWRQRQDRVLCYTGCYVAGVSELVCLDKVDFGHDTGRVVNPIRIFTLYGQDTTAQPFYTVCLPCPLGAASVGLAFARPIYTPGSRPSGLITCLLPPLSVQE